MFRLGRFFALILLGIACAIAPVAQALPCVLHQPQAASPCPHMVETSVPKPQTVADCFTQAVPLTHVSALPDLPVIASLRVSIPIKLHCESLTSLNWVAQHPPPEKVFAATQRWRI